MELAVDGRFVDVFSCFLCAFAACCIAVVDGSLRVRNPKIDVLFLAPAPADGGADLAL